MTLYRIKQGLSSLFAFTRSVDFDLAERYLNSAQMTLFRRFKRGEQLHSLNVLRTLLAQDETPHDLALAASRSLHRASVLRWRQEANAPSSASARCSAATARTCW